MSEDVGDAEIEEEAEGVVEVEAEDVEVDDSVDCGVPEGESVVLDVPDSETEELGVPDWDTVVLGVTLGVALKVLEAVTDAAAREADAVPVLVLQPLGESVPVFDAEAPADKEGVWEAERVGDRLIDVVAVPVPDPEGVGEPDNVVVGEVVPVALIEGVELSVRGALRVGVAVGVTVTAPLELLVGELVGVEAILKVLLGVPLGVGDALFDVDGVEVPLLVPVGLPVEEAVKVAVVELLSDTVALLEGDAPCVSEGVGEAEFVELCEGALDVEAEGVAVDDGVGGGVLLAVSVEVGVAVGVGVPVPLRVAVPDCDTVVLDETLGVALELLDDVAEAAAREADAVPVPDKVDVLVLEPLGESVPVFDAEAPAVKEAVGEAERVVDRLIDVVAVPVPDPEGVGEPDNVVVGEVVPVALIEGVELSVRGALRVGVAVGVTVTAPLELLVGELVGVEAILKVLLGVPLGVGDALFDVDGVEVPLLVPVGLPVEEAVKVAVVELLSDTVALLEGDAPCVSEGVGEAEFVELCEGALDVEAEGVAVDDGVGGGVLLAVSVEVGVAVGVGVPVPLRVAVPDCDTVVLDETLGVALELLDDVAEAAAREADAVPVPDKVDVLVLEPLGESVPVFDAEAPAVKEAVGEAERVVDRLLDEVAVPVPEPEGVGEPEIVEVGEGVPVALREGVEL